MRMKERFWGFWQNCIILFLSKAAESNSKHPIILLYPWYHELEFYQIYLQDAYKDVLEMKRTTLLKHL